MKKTYLIKSISDDTTRFVLIEDGGVWYAEHRALTGDGSWLKTWATGNHVNQYGARLSIRNAFGV